MMNKRICSMRQENKEIMENIMNMKIFQRQFKTFERDFHRRINYLKNEAQGRLSRAVATYEEKDEFMNRERVLKGRCAQDLRKAAINENALNSCLVRKEKNDIFAKLQDTVRTDARVAETGDMIEKGIIGIEPTLEATQDLHSAIVDAADQQTPEKMEESFKLKDDETNSLFSYLDELLKDIHHLHGSIDQLRIENNDLMKSMSESDRKMKRDIKINQDAAQMKLEEAERVLKEKDEARCEMDSLLENVKSLYAKICPDDVVSLQEGPIDDSNVIDYLQNMEKRILDYLMCVEYIRMQEASTEDRPPLVLEAEDDEDEDDATSKLQTLPPVQPRELQSLCDLPILMEMEQEESFLEFEQLKKMAVAVVTEMTSEKSEDEYEDTKSVTPENK